MTRDTQAINRFEAIEDSAELISSISGSYASPSLLLGVTMEEVEYVFRRQGVDGLIKRYRVDILKEVCRRKGLLVGGNKTTLVTRLANAFSGKDSVHDYNRNSVKLKQVASHPSAAAVVAIDPAMHPACKIEKQEHDHKEHDEQQQQQQQHLQQQQQLLQQQDKQMQPQGKIIEPQQRKRKCSTGKVKVNIAPLTIPRQQDAYDINFGLLKKIEMEQLGEEEQKHVQKGEQQQQQQQKPTLKKTPPDSNIRGNTSKQRRIGAGTGMDFLSKLAAQKGNIHPLQLIEEYSGIKFGAPPKRDIKSSSSSPRSSHIPQTARSTGHNTNLYGNGSSATELQNSLNMSMLSQWYSLQLASPVTPVQMQFPISPFYQNSIPTGSLPKMYGANTSSNTGRHGAKGSNDKGDGNTKNDPKFGNEASTSNQAFPSSFLSGSMMIPPTHMGYPAMNYPQMAAFAAAAAAASSVNTQKEGGKTSPPPSQQQRPQPQPMVFPSMVHQNPWMYFPYLHMPHAPASIPTTHPQSATISSVATGNQENMSGNQNSVSVSANDGGEKRKGTELPETITATTIKEKKKRSKKNRQKTENSKIDSDASKPPKMERISGTTQRETLRPSTTGDLPVFDVDLDALLTLDFGKDQSISLSEFPAVPAMPSKCSDIEPLSSSELLGLHSFVDEQQQLPAHQLSQQQPIDDSNRQQQQLPTHQVRQLDKERKIQNNSKTKRSDKKRKKVESDDIAERRDMLEMGSCRIDGRLLSEEMTIEYSKRAKTEHQHDQMEGSSNHNSSNREKDLTIDQTMMEDETIHAQDSEAISEYERLWADFRPDHFSHYQDPLSQVYQHHTNSLHDMSWLDLDNSNLCDDMFELHYLDNKEQ